MSEHTKGPWRYSSRNLDGKNDFVSRIPFAIEYVPPNMCAVAPIADICDQPQAEANARLIAAAPDLLVALRALDMAYVRLLESGRDRIVMLGGECDAVDVMERNDPNLRAARAAIQKATAEKGGGL